MRNGTRIASWKVKICTSGSMALEWGKNQKENDAMNVEHMVKI